MKIQKINYKIKGINIFGIIITTKKQLETCKIDVYVKEDKNKNAKNK